MTLVGGALVIALTVTLVTMSAATMVVEEQVTTQDPVRLHADLKHTRATELRSLWSDGVCEGHELWYSPRQGKILALCGVPKSSLWSGWFWKVRVEDPYELTIFCARRGYWDGIQRRDGYLPIANWPSANRVWRELWH